MKEKIVGLRDLRENMSKYTAEVQGGKTLVVVKRSRALFRIVPIDEEEGWETLIDFTKIKPGGVSASEVSLKLVELIRGDGQSRKSTKKTLSPRQGKS
jgi:prevent-host-death family protein